MQKACKKHAVKKVDFEMGKHMTTGNALVSTKDKQQSNDIKHPVFSRLKFFFPNKARKLRYNIQTTF